MALKKSHLILLLFLLAVVCNPAPAQTVWDWHIHGGTVVDGTGESAYEADLLIRADTIGFIGEVDADTLRTENRVDASGKIVTPGFVDVHAHGNPLEHPEFQNFLAMGVTTILLGQDGTSPAADMNSWFQEVREARPAVNIAALTGHGSLRSRAGAGKAPANDRELRMMEAGLKEDLASGVFGMSTGLEYVPGMYTDRNEMERLAQVAGSCDAIIMSHMRSEDDSEIEASLEELAALGTHARVHVSHLKVVYGEGAGRAEEILEQIDSFRQQGIVMTADVYPYTASFTGIGIVFPDWAKMEEEWKQAVKERPEILRRYLRDKVEQRNGPDAILFGSGPYAGRTLKEASEKEGVSPADLLLETGPRGASAAHFVMNEELQDRIIHGDGIMVSSDGSPSMRHPRGYGSFAKIIRRYVNEKQSMSLEEAVYRMSGLPAETLRLERRGTIAEGNVADLLVFDPREVRDRATYEHPHRPAGGFDWVMVNGRIARENGEFREQRFGTVLRYVHP